MVPDIPIIMGISPFKTRFDLLLEKAELKEDAFEGNEYTEYGNIMEPKIRDYYNQETKSNYIEDKLIKGDIRCHFDGYDKELGRIIEIKTTSQIHNNLKDYKIYLVQLLFYMYHANAEYGTLLVYERPSDFNEEFDKDRLHIYVININDFKELVDEINKAVEQFRIDLQKLKENPFLTEEDLLPQDITELSNKVIAIESQLIAYNDLIKQRDEFKEQLRQAMIERNIKTWETPNGVKITNVLDTPDKEVEEEYYNEDKFIEENAELHERYHNKLAEYKETRTVIKKGRKGSLKITLPKEVENNV